MFTFFMSRRMRWVLPCFSLLLALYAAQTWCHLSAKKSAPADLLERTTAELAHWEPRLIEQGLREKAEAVLAGYGESEPQAVVTVAMTSDWEDVETYVPLNEKKALESIQTVGESCEGSTEYRNTKNAENYLVGHTKTVTHRTSPRLVSVSCLVQVSEDNAHRVEEIERAVAVALGMNFERGDVVMASVK